MLLGSVIVDVAARIDMMREDSIPRRMPQPLECSDVSLRVTKALGSRGYKKARLSAVCRLPDSAQVICPSAEDSTPLIFRHESRSFDYCEPFLHKWQGYHLSSSLVDLQEGPQTVLMAHSRGPLHINVTLPPQRSGVRGVIVGDPCISSRYLPGLCHKQWDVLTTLPRLLNILAEQDKLDFVAILGDAFYDAQGELTAEFWQRLSPKAQKAFLIAVPGNHDLWIVAPWAPLPQDQFGIGFMQWYAQDTAAAAGNTPYRLPASGEWENDVGGEPHDAGESIPPAENFFFYHVLGNVGFLGFSGAHAREEQDPLFREACSFFVSQRPMAIYLLGHWNAPGLGCQEGMDVPAVYEWLTSGACAPVADSLRYMMGHIHCNEQTEDGRGFLLGAAGATGRGCRGPREWGFAYLDTRNADEDGDTRRRSESHWLGKFTVANERHDASQDLEECLRREGSPRRCLGFGEEWINEIKGLPSEEVVEKVIA